MIQDCLFARRVLVHVTAVAGQDEARVELAEHLWRQNKRNSSGKISVGRERAPGRRRKRARHDQT